MITGRMGLAPRRRHFLVLWAHNEVHSAFPSHQAARFRGARASDGVPIQSPIKIVRCPTHASTIAWSVSVTRKRKGPGGNRASRQCPLAQAPLPSLRLTRYSSDRRRMVALCHSLDFSGTRPSGRTRSPCSSRRTRPLCANWIYPDLWLRS